MTGAPDEPTRDGKPAEASPYQAHLAAEAASDDRSNVPSALAAAWRRRWEALSSTQKLRSRQLSIALAIGVLGYGLYGATRSDKPKADAPVASKLDMGAGLRGDSLEEKIRGDFKKLIDTQKTLGDRITAIEEGKSPIGARMDAAPGTGADSDALPPALPGSPPELPPPPTDAEIGDMDALPAPPAPPSAPPAPPIEKMVGAIGEATTPVVPKDAAGGTDSKKKNRTIYLPPGFMKARLLTGIDALASRDATSNPEPQIARVQAPAVLPMT